MMRTVLVAGLLASALVAPIDHAVQSCDWRSEFTATLSQLGEDPVDSDPSVDGIVEDTSASLRVRWSTRPSLITANGREAYGLSHWDVTAEISRRTPCRLVRGVMTHEWMHLQQMRVYGVERAMHLYGSVPLAQERIADCGAELLGAPIRVYTGRLGCREGELLEARELIGEIGDESYKRVACASR